MLSLRSLTRSVPRTISRLNAPVIRHSNCAIRPSFILQSSYIRAACPKLTAAFSTSRLSRQKEGEVDDELMMKFESELQMEKEMSESEELPVDIKDYLDNSPFEACSSGLHDTPGREEVVLTRTFGDEHIKVTFSIADLNALDNDDADQYDDRALEDEIDDEDEDASNDNDSNSLNRSPIPTESAQSGGAKSKQTIPAGRTANGNIATAPSNGSESSSKDPVSATAGTDEDEDEDGDVEDDGDDDEQEPSFPARVNVTITKPNRGALQIETIAQDGMVVIDNVYYHAEAGTESDSAEKTFKRKQLYAGPPFGNLDEDLQVLLERYLDERGINTALALFVPDYIDWKEQKEYIEWLNNVKSFVEA